MRSLRFALACWLLGMVMGGLPARASSKLFAIIDIHFEEHATGFWGRYVVSDDAAHRAGWIFPEGGGEMGTVTGIPAGPNVHFRAIFYAPECSLETVDLTISESRPYQYFFPCKAAARSEIQGILPAGDRWMLTHVQVEASYMVDWARDFLHFDDGTETEIPLASVGQLLSHNRFQLTVPVGPEFHDGRIRLWARDLQTGRIVDQLRLSKDNPTSPRTRLGDIPITALGSAPLNVRVCSANSPLQHDRYGFASRPAESDACQP